MKKTLTLFITILLGLGFATSVFAEGGPASIGSAITVNNLPTFTDAGTDARGFTPGTFGSEYGRMLKLTNGNWLAVYTIYDNNGYTRTAGGGTKLQVARSTDNARTWTVIATLADPGRDMDNGQMFQLPNGDILLACRSVRWQESYRLDVYKSTNLGANWSYLSTIDQNNGAPGSLGNPDRGVYEPHLGVLGDGRLAVFYANEKHALESPAYSQIISEKISTDNGATWGSEIFAVWNPANSASRPGMPVWTKMNNGKYIVTSEVCGTNGCNIYYKISNDGFTWASGIGTQVPNQSGAPYVISLSDGRLALTSNTNQLSFSNDYGATWYLNDTALWPGSFPDYYWSSLYQTGSGEIAGMTSAPRSVGGHNVQMKFASLATSYFNDFAAGNDNGWTRYGGTWSAAGGAYTVTSANADKSIVTPYVSLLNYSVEADVKLNNAGQGSLIFDVTGPSVNVDGFVGYGAGIDSNGTVWLGRFNNGFTSLASVPMTIATGTAYHLKVAKNNGRMQVYVNGVLKIDFTDTTYKRGTIGVRGGFGNSATFDNVTVTPFTYSNDFASNEDGGWTHYGGTWSVASGEYTVASDAAISKSVLNNPVTGTNYTIEGSIRVNNSGQGSLIWDVTNPGVGTDSFKGYGAGIDTNGTVWLGKFNNNYTQLGSAAASLPANTWHQIKIVITGFRIQVYVNNVLRIDVTDSSYNNGSFGVRGGFGNNVSFDNLKVY